MTDAPRHPSPTPLTAGRSSKRQAAWWASAVVVVLLSLAETTACVSPPGESRPEPPTTREDRRFQRLWKREFQGRRPLPVRRVRQLGEALVARDQSAEAIAVTLRNFRRGGHSGSMYFAARELARLGRTGSAANLFARWMRVGGVQSKKDDPRPACETWGQRAAYLFELAHYGAAERDLRRIDSACGHTFVPSELASARWAGIRSSVRALASAERSARRRLPKTTQAASPEQPSNHAPDRNVEWQTFAWLQRGRPELANAIADGATVDIDPALSRAIESQLELRRALTDRGRKVRGIARVRGHCPTLAEHLDPRRLGAFSQWLRDLAHDRRHLFDPESADLLQEVAESEPAIACVARLAIPLLAHGGHEAHLRTLASRLIHGRDSDQPDQLVVLAQLMAALEYSDRSIHYASRAAAMSPNPAAYWRILAASGLLLNDRGLELHALTRWIAHEQPNGQSSELHARVLLLRTLDGLRDPYLRLGRQQARQALDFALARHLDRSPSSSRADELQWLADETFARAQLLGLDASSIEDWIGRPPRGLPRGPAARFQRDLGLAITGRSDERSRALARLVASLEGHHRLAVLRLAFDGIRAVRPVETGWRSPDVIESEQHAIAVLVGRYDP